MEWIFLTVVFGLGFVYEIVDRICECRERKYGGSEVDKYKDFLL